MIQPTEWSCKFCGRDQVFTSENYEEYFHKLPIGNTKIGEIGARLYAIRCLNDSCKELTFLVAICNHFAEFGQYVPKNTIHSWLLLPESISKPQPEYIPSAIRQDYFEACLIISKSPKASATLARRCLQGMIRDFCDIRKKTLYAEIAELRRQVNAGSAPKGVEEETVDAIDAIRSVGNIGAHMENDINLIIDVDDGEAQALVELIEMLFDEWYVARHNRQQKLVRVQAIAAEKAAAIDAGRAAAQANVGTITDQTDNTQ